ncbi:MAG: EndoU domain-containing protein [Rhodospirillales bacterium]
MVAWARLRRMAWVLAAALVLGGNGGIPVEASDCRAAAFHWSDGAPAVNLRHVFCGELRRGRPLGVHSMRLVGTSPVVTAVAPRPDGRDGIYDARVRFRNGATKFSTFFPDACTVEQVVASIRHAATHGTRDHPQWGKLGPSAPAADAAGFCLDAAGRPFDIRIGVLADGRVNTAFPD